MTKYNVLKAVICGKASRQRL